MNPLDPFRQLKKCRETKARTKVKNKPLVTQPHKDKRIAFQQRNAGLRALAEDNKAKTLETEARKTAKQKLKEITKRNVRARYQQGCSTTQLAAEFKVGLKTIYNYINGIKKTNSNKSNIRKSS